MRTFLITTVWAVAIIFMAGAAWAADETAAIDSIKTEIEVTKNQSTNNNSRIQGLEADLAAENAARQSADQNLQNQIYTIELTQGPEGQPGSDGLSCWDLNGSGTCDPVDEDKTGDGICDASDCQGPPGSTTEFTPPTINYTIDCQDAISFILNLNIVDDTEIAYYVIQQQGGEPPLNMITFVEPGINVVDYGFFASVFTEMRTFLLVAADIEGNTNKTLVEIQPDICLEPCPPGTICPE